MSPHEYMRGPYPEHDKLAQVVEDSQTIGEFLDYGLRDQGLVLARWSGNLLFPAGDTIDDILAHYFKINRTALEEEKQQMLRKVAWGEES